MTLETLTIAVVATPAFGSSPHSGSMHSNGGLSAYHEDNFSPAQGSGFSQNSGSLGIRFVSIIFQ